MFPDSLEIDPEMLRWRMEYRFLGEHFPKDTALRGMKKTGWSRGRGAAAVCLQERPQYLSQNGSPKQRWLFCMVIN